MKILITGALGHIGSKLIRELSKDSVKKIILLDNFLTQRYASLFDLPNDFKYQFIQEDITTFGLRGVLDDVDVVIHLAAMTDAESSHSKPEEVEKVNLEGLKKVADACLEKNVKLLFPSTTSVYGSAESVVDETSTALKPQSPYAESKLAAEKYLQDLKSQGLNFVICRLGTIFGWSIGMRFHTAVNKFIWQAVNGQPLSVWQTAWQQKRPYLDLTDCISAVNFILEKDLFDGEIYNVVTKNFTVEDIVAAIKKSVPELKVNFVESPIMNQLSYDVKADKFEAKGFSPKGDLEQGISQTIKKLKAIAVPD